MLSCNFHNTIWLPIYKNVETCWEYKVLFDCSSVILFTIGHFTVMYLVAKPLIWSEAEGDLVVIETSI